MDNMEADIADKPAEHTVDVTVDAEGVGDGVEEEVHLLRRRRTTTYLKSVDRSPHSLVEEQDYSMPRIPLNASIIGIIVSHAGLTLKMGIHPQHAHGIGGRQATRKGATETIYSSILRPDTLHR